MGINCTNVKEVRALITDIEEAEARQLVKTHRCDEPGCNGRLSVAWGGHWRMDHYVLRCGKDADHKAIKPYFGDEQEIAMTTAGSTTLVKYDTPLGPVELSVEAIRRYLCPKATVEEAYIFLQKCRFQRLNPFMGEAYLVVYEATQNSPRTAQMIIGKEAHTRRAERHPDYLGMKGGVIVLRAGAITEVAGAFMAPNDQLLGGWCQVLRKGKEPFYIAVSLKEYDKGRSQWRQMPATMIRKVAVVQALREAFPSEMAGLQGSDEFEIPEDQANVIEGEIAAHNQMSKIGEPDGTVGPLPREGRDVERDIDDLFPPDPWLSQEEMPAPDERFDPETAPPPPLPDTVHSRGHLEQILKDEGWSLARLEIQVLKNMTLDRYLREGHKIQDAYLAWREHVGKAPA